MEDAVVAALKLSKMEQHRAFEKKIRKDGILKMNVSVMEKGHNLVRDKEAATMLMVLVQLILLSHGEVQNLCV